jgi:hypothetical protein
MGRARGMEQAAVAVALRVFVHWAFVVIESEHEGYTHTHAHARTRQMSEVRAGQGRERGDDEENEDSVEALQRFLSEACVMIPCLVDARGGSGASDRRCGREAESAWGWRRFTDVCFIDDRSECGSCSFGCRAGCECVFGHDVLAQCAKLPPFAGLCCSAADYHRHAVDGRAGKEHLRQNIFIKNLKERLSVFYTEVLGLSPLSQCLHPCAILGDTGVERERLPASVVPVVVALRALQVCVVCTCVLHARFCCIVHGCRMCTAVRTRDSNAYTHAHMQHTHTHIHDSGGPCL